LSFFQYLDQTAQKNPNGNCILTIPDKEFEILENEDDQCRADKILQFFSFNIFLKAGKLYLTKHDGSVFTRYDELSTVLNELNGKVFIDIMADEKDGFFKAVYILYHTEEEIIVFTVKMNIETGTTFNIFYSINKQRRG
jgi:hypothetical protein